MSDELPCRFYDADGETISAAEFAAVLNARIAALETQLLAAQQANTRLIARIVELEHERDEARDALERLAAQAGHEVMRWVDGRRGASDDDEPAETPPPPPMPVEDAVSSVASQLAAMIVQKRLDAGHTITFAGDAAPPRAVTPSRLCDHCTLPLVSAHIADETVITDGTRQAHVHHVCMSAYPGWTVVATARGGA